MPPTTTKEIIASVGSGHFEGRSWPDLQAKRAGERERTKKPGGGLFMSEIPSDVRLVSCEIFLLFLSIRVYEPEGFGKDGRTTDTKMI